MRTRLGIVTTLLLAPVLAACGGSPDAASTKDFCAAWSADSGNDLAGVHARAKALEEVGTPDDIDDDARDGFEVFVEQLGSIDQDQLEQLDQAVADTASLADVYGIDEDDAADVVAFFDYVNQTCTSADGESPSAGAGAEPDQEGLEAFAAKYLAVLEQQDGSSADALACDGDSVLHDVVSANDAANWELGPVTFTEPAAGFAELRETVGDSVMGMQAQFRDGEWCALQ